MIRKHIIVRDRYQITIPDEIRSELSWLKLNEVLTAYVEDGKLIIEPIARAKRKRKKEKSWEEIYKDMEMVRELMVPYNDGQDSTKLINEDRESR
jgi:bifunctional DNA-binding transcriptional regulator/antitoxin component of YhaV-PrlF toxin-antitoxin module